MRAAFRPKRLLLGLRGAALLLADAAFLLFHRRVVAQKRKTVLIVRLDRIGDFLLWLPAMRALRTLYPRGEYNLMLLGNPAWVEIAREQNIFDQVWALDVRRFVWNWAYRYRQMTRVRRAAAAILVQARCSRELLVEDALTRASGAAQRVAFAREAAAETRLQRPISDRWHTRLIPAPAAGTMELERNAELIRALGLAEFRSSMPVLETGPAPKELPGRYYILFPSAGWAGRQWPAARFAEIAGRLHGQTGWTGVVCGGPDDAALGEALLRETEAPVENWAGKTSLSEMSAVFAGAELVVANETSGVHMAAAVGTPSVCILGGGHFGRFVPYQIAEGGASRALPLPVFEAMPCFGCNWHCIYPVRSGDPVPCVANVAVDKVWAAIQSILTTDREATAMPTSGA